MYTSDLAKKIAMDNKILIENVDSSIEKSGLPPVVIMELIDKVNKKLECDADCEQKKIVEEYKKKWENSKKIAQRSIPNEECAEKKYYVAYKGEDYYKNKILRPRYNKEINEFVKELNEQLLKIIIETASIESAYSAGYISLSRLKELEINKLQEYNKLQKRLDYIIQSGNTSERKVFYKFQDIDSQKFYYKWIIIAYYILLAVFFILNILKNQNFKNKLFWLLIIIIAIIPYILKYILRYTFNYLQDKKIINSKNEDLKIVI